MKVSLITVVFNAQETIAAAMQSIFEQDYQDLEYLVIDGGSTDGTLELITAVKDQIDILITEPDRGMYDALNKGIARANGDVIGILNADDLLADPEAITKVVAQFQKSAADGVYGDLNYVDRDRPDQIIRKWRSKQVEGNTMRYGWMPAHPTLYLKKGLFEQFGNYSLDFGSAADYELMLRFIYKHQIKISFLDKLLVNMRVGGMSNQSAKHRKQAFINDWKALKQNRVPLPYLAIALKKLSKLKQFF